MCLVHVRNLHPGVFWPCERCFKNLHPGANLLLPSRWCKFICTLVQIVHMNANCIISIHYDGRFSINGLGVFYYDVVKKRLKINFKLSLIEKNIMFIILIILQHDI